MTERRRAPRAEAADPEKLRTLMRTIAHAALASTVVSGCTVVHDGYDPNEAPSDGDDDLQQDESSVADDIDDDAPPAWRDASVRPRPPRDGGGASVDAGPRDGAARDAGAPIDGGRLIDATAGDAGTRDGGDDASAGEWRAACETLQSRALSEVRTTRPVDFLGVYHEVSGNAFGEPPGTPLRPWVAELQTLGDPCASSESTLACERRHALAIQASASCATAACSTWFSVTRNDLANERLDGAGLRALLGEIDTALEAVLLALFEGHVLSCDPIGVPGQVVPTELRVTGAGYELRTTYDSCGDGVYRVLVEVAKSGSVTLLERTKITNSSCAIGRRPAGLRAPQAAPARAAAGRFLAEVARLEAASVTAFAQIVRELESFGAPRGLLEAALQAMADEVRHASAMGRLARRFGVAAARPELASAAPRSLLELAIDNAVEGCTREMYGALVATYQAQRARDPEVRAAMQEIADDETRHAAFSVQLASWLQAQLTPAQNELVESARVRALSELGEQLDFMMGDDELALLGLPSAEVGARLLQDLTSAVAA